MIPECLTAAFNVVAKFLGFQQHRSELKNTPEMKAAAEAQKEADASAEDLKIIENADEKSARNRIS